MVTLNAAELAITRPAADMASKAKPATGVLGKTKWFLMNIRTAFEVHSERRQLLKLTDDQLSDIGVTRHQVNTEGNRSFFDIPNR
ncbi:MAG: DUF1127 domain-containing protein [Pseudomonadota bacterium]